MTSASIGLFAIGYSMDSKRVIAVAKMRNNGGERGIRTPESLSTLTVFKTAGFNHSPIPPTSILPDSIMLRGMSLCHFWLFCLSRHVCHYFVTTRQLCNRARLRIEIRVRVPHGRV